MILAFITNTSYRQSTEEQNFLHFSGSHIENILPHCEQKVVFFLFKSAKKLYILYMNTLTLNFRTIELKPRLLQDSALLSLDYVNSDDPAEIDNGIRDTIKGFRLSVLAMGLGLVKIKSNKLFIKLGYKNMTKYLEGLSEDTKTERSSIYNWLSIGEAYIKYKNELDTIGFSDSDSPTKLPYLKRALAVREKQEVFGSIKKMSLREFINFSKGEIIEPPADMPYVNINGNIVYIEGKRAIILNKDLGRKTSAYFQKVINVACEALEKGGVIVPIYVRNMKEARRLQRAAERMKAKIRLRQGA